MAAMRQIREHPWLMFAVLVVVFLSALSMRTERVGWSFLILCFVVGSVGALGVFWLRDQLFLRWNRLPQSTRGIGISIGIILLLLVTFATNRHKPDKFANDALTCFAVIVAFL